MRRVTTFAIGMLLLCAVAIPVHATTMTDADANGGRTSNFDPALNAQPIGGCGFLENFDIVLFGRSAVLIHKENVSTSLVHFD